MNTDVLYAILATLGTSLLGVLVWVFNRILDENKDSHRQFSKDIRELFEEINTMNEELVKLGMVSKEAIANNPIARMKQDKITRSIGQLNQKVAAVTEEVGTVKKLVQPEEMGGMILYEPIPVYLARISRKQEEQEQFNGNTLKVLSKHNDTMVRLKENQVKIVEAVKKINGKEESHGS